jgi:hypothetical protein
MTTDQKIPAAALLLLLTLAGACVTDDTDTIVQSPVVSPHAAGPAHFTGTWRVQWNAGSPIITPLALDAPAGVQIGLGQLGLRGAASFYAVSADETNGGTVLLHAAHNHGHDYLDRVSLGLQAAAGMGSQLVTVDALVQARLAAASPPISAPLGSLALQGRIISRMITNTGTVNDTDPALEDAMIWASGSLTFGAAAF